MKVRSAEELLNRIDGDLAWRRSELVAFHRAIGDAKGMGRRALLRGSIAILYAHWEGFIKESAYLYLCMLASQKLTMQSLRPELAGLVMRSQLVAGIETKNPLAHTEIVRSLREDATNRAKIPTVRSAVRTESNLTYKVLAAILSSLGLDVDPFEAHRDLIDSELVAVRNRVVHGEHEAIALEEWSDLCDEILALMSQVRDQIQNAAVEKTYLAWRA